MPWKAAPVLEFYIVIQKPGIPAQAEIQGCQRTLNESKFKP
jgi:hypothetical protein